VRESDIRPADLMARYLALSAEDAERVLSDASARQDVPCPGCGSEEAGEAFAKHGFRFVDCTACGSLYVSPRPRAADLDLLYRDSPSATFWAREFHPAVAPARRERIVRPRVQRILGHPWMAGLGDGPTVVDVGAGAGAFLAELRAARPAARAVAVEPGRELADQARAEGLEVVEEPVEGCGSLAGAGDLVTSFEVLEHVHDPLAFVAALARLARPGGQVLVTCLGGDGFDVQSLRGEAHAVSPPHHLNFLSVAGLERLFARAGLEDVEVETPGELDAELVATALGDGRGDGLPPFYALLLERRSPEVRDAFQRFLREARLSSHAWVWGRRSA
jgi:SAM-dependent methyltransferase